MSEKEMNELLEELSIPATLPVYLLIDRINKKKADLAKELKLAGEKNEPEESEKLQKRLEAINEALRELNMLNAHYDADIDEMLKDPGGQLLKTELAGEKAGSKNNVFHKEFEEAARLFEKGRKQQGIALARFLLKNEPAEQHEKRIDELWEMGFDYTFDPEELKGATPRKPDALSPYRLFNLSDLEKGDVPATYENSRDRYKQEESILEDFFLYDSFPELESLIQKAEALEREVAKSPSQEFTEAQLEPFIDLGLAYLKGEIAPFNPKKAQMWLTQAYFLNSKKAEYYLALMTLAGLVSFFREGLLPEIFEKLAEGSDPIAIKSKELSEHLKSLDPNEPDFDEVEFLRAIHPDLAILYDPRKNYKKMALAALLQEKPDKRLAAFWNQQIEAYQNNQKKILQSLAQKYAAPKKEDRDQLFDETPVSDLDPKEQLEMLNKKAEETKSQDDLYELASFLLKQPQPDYSRIFSLLQEAEKKGSWRAARELAILYENGLGISRSLDRAVSLYRKAAKAEDVYAMTRLGEILAEKNRTFSGKQTGFKLAQKAFSLGYKPALRVLGKMYLYGLGISQNTTKGLHYLEMAALFRNDMEAAKELRDYMNHSWEFRRSGWYSLWNKFVESSGYFPGLTDMASEFLKRQNSYREYDEKKAYFLNRRAERFYNDPKARANLGEMYFEGWGVAQDDEMAFAYFQGTDELSPDQLYAKAMTILNLFGNENQAESDAYEMLQEAADKGSLRAYRELHPNTYYDDFWW